MMETIDQEERTILSYWINEIAQLEKDQFLKEQQTRKAEPFQQDSMCQENYLPLQEHCFLKRLLCCLMGKLPCVIFNIVIFTGISKNIALMQILHCLTWNLHIKKVTVYWKARDIWCRNIAYLKGYHIIWKKIAFFKRNAASFRGFLHSL